MTKIVGPLSGPDANILWPFAKEVCTKQRFRVLTWFAVLDDQDKPVAIGGISLKKKTIGPTFVAPLHRGRGLQRALTRARLDYAVMNGLSYVIAFVDYDNSYSLRNLLQMGFLVVDYDEYDGCALELTLKWSAPQ